ncbi:MAG: DUF2141 domain-containing protein [Flavobacteriaceae bacterium]|nr:DUF2141 domain-containing protein [Flavobacteriaceae bacterium]
MKKLKILILLLSFSINAQFNNDSTKIQRFKLKIEISKIKHEGNLYLAIYNNAIDFNSRDRSNDRVYYGIKENVKIGNYIKEIELNKGIYSVKIYIDKNYNNKFDFNIFGLPKEQYGFSNDAMNLFGAPDFEKALFKLNINKTIKINLR